MICLAFGLFLCDQLKLSTAFQVLAWYGEYDDAILGCFGVKAMILPACGLPHVYS